MSASKDKGTSWETACVRWLRDHGYPSADRSPQRGRDDQGDIQGIPGIVIECKNTARTELAQWLAEAAAEALKRHDHLAAARGPAVPVPLPVPVVWHKRRGKASPGDGYVTMTGAAFTELLGMAIREDTHPREGDT